MSLWDANVHYIQLCVTTGIKKNLNIENFLMNAKNTVVQILEWGAKETLGGSQPFLYY